MKMSMLVTFYSSNYEHDPATFYQGCGSLKSQKDDLSNITKLVLSQVWWLDVAIYTLISSVQLLSCVQLFVTPCIAARQASLYQLPEPTQTHVHREGDAIQPSHLLSSPSPPSFSLSSWSSRSFPVSQFFPSGGQSIGVSTSASVLPINVQDWFPFRMDQLDLLTVQGILKRLLQHHSSKASILWRKS